MTTRLVLWRQGAVAPGCAHECNPGSAGNTVRASVRGARHYTLGIPLHRLGADRSIHLSSFFERHAGTFIGSIMRPSLSALECDTESSSMKACYSCVGWRRFLLRRRASVPLLPLTWRAYVRLLRARRRRSQNRERQSAHDSSRHVFVRRRPVMPVPGPEAGWPPTPFLVRTACARPPFSILYLVPCR